MQQYFFEIHLILAVVNKIFPNWIRTLLFKAPVRPHTEDVGFNIPILKILGEVPNDLKEHISKAKLSNIILGILGLEN